MTDSFSSIETPTAPERQGQLTLEQLLAITADIHHQPDWRSAANKACAYYDGEQLSPELIATLQERSQPLTMHNLIAPTPVAWPIWARRAAMFLPPYLQTGIVS